MKFLFVVLAMMSLASCNKTVFKYEITSENTEESYNAELIYGTYLRYKNNDLFDNENKPYRRVVYASRPYILSKFLIASDEILSNNIMYNITDSEESCSLSISDLNKHPLSKNDYRKLCDDFVKNVSIVADTTYEMSYRLNVSDEEKFAKAKNINQTIKLTPDEIVFSEDGYYQQIKKQNDTIDGFVNNIRMLTNNLRSFHHIPVLHQDYSMFTETRILIRPEFYAESKSVEDVNVMLSEYGLSLEPTGGEMMTVTLTSKPVQKLILREKGYFTFEFWAFLFFLLMVAFVISLGGCDGISLSIDDIEKRDKVLMPRDVRSEEEKKRLRLYSIPFFALSLLFLIAFVIVFLRPELKMFEDYAVLISFAVVMFSIGVFVVRWRPSYYDKKGKTLRVVTSVFYVIYTISQFFTFGFIVISDEISSLRIVFLVLLVISLIVFAITAKKLKKCEVIKPEDGDEE